MVIPLMPQLHYSLAMFVLKSNDQHLSSLFLFHQILFSFILSSLFSPFLFHQILSFWSIFLSLFHSFLHPISFSPYLLFFLYMKSFFSLLFLIHWPFPLFPFFHLYCFQICSFVIVPIFTSFSLAPSFFLLLQINPIEIFILIYNKLFSLQLSYTSKIPNNHSQSMMHT